MAYRTASWSGEAGVCRNCGTIAEGHFCGQCGQEQQYAPLPLRDWVSAVIKDLTALDRQTPRTLWALLFRPGFLTLEWLDGRRARYHAPLRLYLWCAGAFFLIWTLFARPSLLPDVLTGYLDGVGGSQLAANQVARLGDLFPVLLAFLIPVFAFLTKIFFGKQRRFYSEHAVFALHFHAFFFLSAAVTFPLRMTNLPGVSGIGFYWALFYCDRAIKRALGGTSTTRIAAFVVVYGVIAAIGVILTAEILV